MITKNRQNARSSNTLLWRLMAVKLTVEGPLNLAHMMMTKEAHQQLEKSSTDAGAAPIASQTRIHGLTLGGEEKRILHQSVAAKLAVSVKKASPYEVSHVCLIRQRS